MPKSNNTLFGIYGCRHSKDGKRLNITLISGENDNKSYATVSLKLDDKRVKEVKGGKGYWVFVKMLGDKKVTEQPKEKQTEDDMPF